MQSVETAQRRETYGKIVKVDVPKYGYRWQGRVEVDVEGYGRLNLIMMGNIAQWLIPGERVKLVIIGEPKQVGDITFLDYTDYELYRYYGKSIIKVWPVFQKLVEHPRYDPLTGKILYKYKILAREALTEEDYVSIVELEQYHYASEEEIVAVWRCPSCGRYYESNIQPKCQQCNIPCKLVEIRGSLPSSRFLVLELVEREPYEPRIVGYVRVDTPIPLMSRRIVKEDGTVVIEKFIREKVFGKSWFHPTFWPLAYTKRKELFTKYKELASIYGKRLAKAMVGDMLREMLHRCNTAAARIARVVIHPDYRGDGLGVLAVRLAVEWIAERRVPEMKRKKHLVEVIAQMARYNPFFEKAGFIYLWDTASGRPVLYYPLTDIARKKIEEFLKNDPYARKHGGRLYRPRYSVGDPLAGPIIFKSVAKVYRSTLDLSSLRKELQDVLRAFGVDRRVVERTVLRDVNLQINPGEIVVLVGASGAGKTTFLRLVLGRVLGETDEKYAPTEGTVEVPSNARAAALIPGEHEPKFGNESLLEHMYNKIGDAHAAIEVLNICGLSDAVLYRARFDELSTGQKERAKIASLLAERPNLLLIDEFTAHLDALTAMRVARKLAEVCRRFKITLIVATNRREVIDALNPDKLIYIGYGGAKIVERRVETTQSSS
ncbi:MAG: ATP-binding cassette domain-containing protein [Crenarchaeota archaeon]|nr:ATP-binding cassette domain-containing protein [Thermoproteota archaeon]